MTLRVGHDRILVTPGSIWRTPTAGSTARRARCERVMAEELAAAPSPETAALAERLRS